MMRKDENRLKVVEEQETKTEQNSPSIDGAISEAPSNSTSTQPLEPEVVLEDPEKSQEDDSESTPEDPKDAKIASLESELEEQVELVNAIKRQHGEAIAEFNNARARLKREVGREVQNSLKSLISELLETLDNLERAIESASSKHEESELLTGVTMVRDQFVAKLFQLGVKRIESKNAKFDPNFHEAISMVAVPSQELDGQIVGIIKEGYMMNEEVLRAAVVAVGKCSSSSDAETTPEKSNGTEEVESSTTP